MVCAIVAGVTPAETYSLWEGQAPGKTVAEGGEKRLTNRPRPFYQLTNIANPTLEAFIPENGVFNGTAVLICPGGGMQRLAYEHEGLEVAKWLNSQRVMAFVLKYRIPTTALEGLMDAQRAMGIIRSEASRWGLRKDSVGFLGFSAGGEIGTWLACRYEGRAYARVDARDDVSCRPDFVGLVYPGGLIDNRTRALKADLSDSLHAAMPPVFMTHAFNDGCENSLLLALALKQLKVPTELHLFQEGGHGFGVRRTGVSVDVWKTRFSEWLKHGGYLDDRPIRDYADIVLSAAQQGRPHVPTISDRIPGVSLDRAYAAQRRLIRLMSAEDPIAGFKGAAASAGAQSRLGLEGPLAGVLFKSGRIDMLESKRVALPVAAPIVVETELAFEVAVDISYEVLTEKQAREAVAKVYPVVELPRNLFEAESSIRAPDLVAVNVGSDRYLVGKGLEPKDVDVNELPIDLRRDGNRLHSTTGGNANGGQWKNLQTIMNQLTGNGHTIKAGSLILSGALGGVQEGKPGLYEAHFGQWQTLKFKLEP